jgi:hypothetical protein
MKKQTESERYKVTMSNILPKLSSADFVLKVPVKRVPELVYNPVLNASDLGKPIYTNLPK